MRNVNVNQKEMVYDCGMTLSEYVKGHKYMMMFKKNKY